MTLFGSACARPTPSITMNGEGCLGTSTDLMTGREVVALHNETDDIVGFEFMLLHGSYDDYAGAIAAIQADVANAPITLGVPSTQVHLPSTGVPYGDDARLEGGEEAEIVLEVNSGMTLAVICTRYGPLAASVRQIAAVGPFNATP